MHKDTIKALSILLPILQFVIIIIIFQNMPHDGIIGKKLFFMMFPFLFISLLMAYLAHEIMVVIQELIPQVFFYCLTIFLSWCFLFYFFPCSQNFCTTDIIYEVSRVKALRDEVKIKDIFKYENDDFVKKLIIRKYKLNHYVYDITIHDTTGKFSNKYHVILHKEELYSNNGNLTLKKNTDSLLVEDFNPTDNSQKFTYNLPKVLNIDNYQHIRVNSNDKAIRVYIKKENIIGHNFGFLDFIARSCLGL